MRQRCLVLFTKPARPGRVKTRMIPTLSARQAADLHQAFLDDLVPRLRQGEFDLRIAWALEEGESPPDLDVPSFPQRGDDLGERLFDGLARVARDYRSVAAIGSDHPEIGVGRIEEAFDCLAGGDRVVLGPAADGGYYLFAATAETVEEELFRDVPWSTAKVFETTLERCRERGIEPRVLPAGHDVDSPQDLERLARQIALGAQPCPHVERLLRSWGRLA